MFESKHANPQCSLSKAFTLFACRVLLKCGDDFRIVESQRKLELMANFADLNRLVTLKIRVCHAFTFKTGFPIKSGMTN